MFAHRGSFSQDPHRRFCTARLHGLGALAAVALGACGESPEPVMPAAPEPFEIIVEPARLTLQAGGDGQLAGQVNDRGGQPIGGAALSFQAEDEAMLRVSARGKIASTGRAASETNVIVTSGARELRVPVTILHGPLERIEAVAGAGQQVIAGEAPAEPLAVRALDAWGNPIANVTLSGEVAPEQLPLPSVASGADGIAHLALPKLTRAGTAVASVHPPETTAPAASFRIEVAPGPPAAIELGSVTRPAQDEAGGEGPNVALRVVDQLENPVSGVELRAGASGASAMTTLKTDADGIARIALPASEGEEPLTLEASIEGEKPVRERFTIERSPQAEAD